MSLAFAVVYEAAADFRTATELADRVLIESLEWLDAELIEHQRVWVGDYAGALLTWKWIAKNAKERGIVVSGFFDDKPGEADAKATRRAILFLRLLFPNIDAMMLIRDRDDQPSRRVGLEQGRKQGSAIPVVVGLAVVEREAWVICGFEPVDESETSRLESERQTLGFDPRLRSHELTACKDDRAKRSPKRVLKALGREDRDREQDCWRKTSLDVLRSRGDENGLAPFLGEVRERLAPLLGHVAKDRPDSTNQS